MPKVFIPNRGGHDYSDAARFGEIIFITEGLLDPTKTGLMYRQLVHALKDSRSDDFLLLSGLPILNTMAGAIMGRMHGVLNLLVFHYGEYIQRTFMLDNLINAVKALDDALVKTQTTNEEKQHGSARVCNVKGDNDK